jgi:hypothetical protein
MISRTPSGVAEQDHTQVGQEVLATVRPPAAPPVAARADRITAPMGGPRFGLRAGVADGLYAGAGIAITWVGLDRVPAGTGLWPLVISRVVSVLAILPLVAATQTPLRIPYDIVVKAAAAGTVGTVGTWLYMLATREQLLAVVSVLSALYPAIPVLLALIFCANASPPHRPPGSASAPPRCRSSPSADVPRGVAPPANRPAASPDPSGSPRARRGRWCADRGSRPRGSPSGRRRRRRPGGRRPARSRGARRR